MESTHEKRILFLSQINFGCWAKVGSNYLAEQFAKDGWKVAYLSNNISFLHIRRRGFKIKFSIWRRKGEHVMENLWQYVPLTLLPFASNPPLKRDFVWNNWVNFCLPNLRRTLRAKGFSNVEIVFLDNLRFVPLLSKIDYRTLVFRLADKNTAFKDVSSQIKEAEEQALKKADYVLFASYTLLTEYTSLYPDIAGKFVHLANGVDLSFIEDEPKLPQQYIDIPSPRIIYLGPLTWWFDFNLLEATVIYYPTYSFVFIGPVIDNQAKHLEEFHNVHFLGAKQRFEIYPYLYHANVGIIPFNTSLELVHYIHPLKLYEYAACGLPIVATKWEELKYITSPAHLAETDTEFIRAIHEAVQIDEVTKEEHRNFAKQNAWDKRYSKLLNSIKEGW